jgi:hypothetical protein
VACPLCGLSGSSFNHRLFCCFVWPVELWTAADRAASQRTPKRTSRSLPMSRSLSRLEGPEAVRQLSGVTK